MSTAILKSFHKTHKEVHTQTQTQISDTQQCGLIEVSLHNQIYILNCFHCADEYPIWNWENFVAHMNSEHFDNKVYELDNTNTDEIEEKIDHKVYELDNTNTDEIEDPIIEDIRLKREVTDDVSDCSSSDFTITKMQHESDEDLERVNFAEIEEVENRENFRATPTAVELEQDNAIIFKGITIRPIRARNTKKKTVRSLPVWDNHNTRQNKTNAPKEDNTDLDEVVLFEKPYDTDDENDDDEEPEASRNCIFFTKTNPAVVYHFLDLIRAHPELYTYRRRPATAYDAAVAEITTDLNNKWNLKFLKTAVAESIMRTRYWFKYVLQRLNDKPQQYRTKFGSYYEKCAAFLPSANLVQPPARLNCSICHKYILNAIQLQNHKFLEHNEGELYYKCNQCDQRFEQPAEKQQHIRTEHKRLKAEKLAEQEAPVQEGCVCDVCGKKFTTQAICKQHRKRHDKPLFNCDLCSKGFHLSFLLKEHKRYHEQKFEFACDQCDHAFLHKRTLKQHIKGVHKREIKCKICGTAYTNHMSVVRHLKRDHLVIEGTNEELEQRLIANKIKRVLDPETQTYCFMCGVCGLKCSGKRPFGLVRHMMKKHGYVPIDQNWRPKKPRKNSRTITNDAMTTIHSSDDDQDEDREAVSGIMDVDNENIIEEKIVEEQAAVDDAMRQVVHEIMQTPNATTAVNKIINMLTKQN